MIRGTLARRADALIEAREPFVAATVIRAKSPTSVRAGDAALIGAHGIIEGFVGGACAEASVRLHALRALETGEPLLLRILPGEDDGEAAAGEGAVTVHNPCLSGGALEIFLEPHLPAAHVLVLGETPVAGALIELGAALGLAMVSGDEREAPEAGDAAVIVASHGQDEEQALASALRAGVPFVGLVASVGAAARCARHSMSPMSCATSCTRRPASTSARGRRRRSRSRSSRRWSPRVARGECRRAR